MKLGKVPRAAILGAALGGFAISGIGAAPNASAAQVTCAPAAPFTNCVQFTYSGGQQSFTVPTGVKSINARLLGASATQGGTGGTSTGTVAVTPGQVLTVTVGQVGTYNSGTAAFGGGGAGGGCTGAGFCGRGGGGISALWNGAANVAGNALLVAGGGGGAGGSSGGPVGGGAGGGAAGQNGINPGGAGGGGQGGGGAGGGASCGTAGAGAQFAGASGGGNVNGGGGGGGGWFGGGGGACGPSTFAGGGGGGGSGYVNGPGVTAASTTQGGNGLGANGVITLQWRQIDFSISQPTVPAISAGGTGNLPIQLGPANPNSGDTGANVNVSLTAPPGITFTGNPLPGSCTQTSTTLTCTNVTPGAGPLLVPISVATGAAPGSTISGGNGTVSPFSPATADPNPANNTTVLTVKVLPLAPAITGPANGSQVTNQQPQISGTGSPGDTVTVTDGSGNVVCTATVQAGGTWSCTPANPLAPGSQTLTPTSTGANGSSSAGSPATFTVLPKLQITKSSSPSGTVTSGSVLTYTVTVANPSNVDYPNATFTDNLAQVLANATWNDQITSSAGTASLVGQSLTWNGTVPAGGTVTVVYTVTVS